MPSETPGYAAWVDVLARMEADARAATRDEAVPQHWTPQRPVGPIPAELVERARAALAAQQQAIGLLEEQRDLAARHLAALRSVPATRGTTPSVYLDVLG